MSRPEHDALAVNEPDAVKIKAWCVNYLRTHRKWYNRWSRFYCNGTKTLNVLIIVFTTLTSILAASSVDRWLDGGGRVLLVVLPGLASLCSALLMQLKMPELGHLREKARIDIEELICRAYREIPTEDPAGALNAAMTFRLEAHKIERSQALDYFSLYREKQKERAKQEETKKQSSQKEESKSNPGKEESEGTNAT